MSRELVNKVAVNSCVFFLVKTEIMHYLLLRSLFRAWLHIHPDQECLVASYTIRRETIISFTWELSTTSAPSDETRSPSRGSSSSPPWVSSIWAPGQQEPLSADFCYDVISPRPRGALFSCLPHVETSALQQDPDDGRSPA